MRTTLDLDDVLLKETRKRAIESGKTLTATIEDALRVALHRRPEGSPRRRRVKLPTVPGWGLRPGLDLNNTGALLDAMDAWEKRPASRRR